MTTATKTPTNKKRKTLTISKINTTVTSKQRVYNLLKSGKWIDRFAIENVGGIGGMRRLRELRADGYTITKRAHPDYLHEFQYRLIKK